MEISGSEGMKEDGKQDEEITYGVPTNGGLVGIYLLLVCRNA